MTEKHFLNYEQSLALKELEFNEGCFAWYQNKTLRFDISSKQTLKFHDFLGRFKDGVLAPLKTQAFEFFRSKGFESFISSPRDKESNQTGYHFSIDNYSIAYEFYTEPENKPIGDWAFASYEEAENALINKLISLLNNNKLASIDRTYANSYIEYKEFKDWANGKVITFWTGQKLTVSDYIYDQKEEDFSEGELSIMNTPTCLDIYLIQNCPCEFVQERMKSVYSKESFEQFKTVQFPLLKPDNYLQNRKIKITKSGKLPLRNKGINFHQYWWLQCENYNWGFHDDFNIWVDNEQYLPNNTNTSHHKTVKSLIRFLRKQYLPIGLEFRLLGRYIGEEYTIKIK